MRSRGTIIFVLAILLLPAVTSGQTDVSVRIRSLGPTFRGLLDDYLTDVYLNPARVSELDGSMVYAVKLPTETITSSLPVARAYLWDGSLTEDQYLYYDIRPIGLSYFGALGGALALSLGTEVDVGSSEDLDDQRDVDIWEEGVNVIQLSRGRTSDVQHYLVDLTIAALSNPLGGRITAAYDSQDSGDGEVRDRSTVRVYDLDNVLSDYGYRFFQRKAERLAVSAAVGLSMPGRLVRDLVLGGGFLEETLTVDHRSNDISDYDADENGEWYNGQVFYNRATNTYASERHYRGYDFFSRVHLEWSERVRSTHAGGWSRSTGDGDGAFELENRRFDESTDYFSNNHVEYRYDGTMDRFWLESSIGYQEFFLEDVLVAFALHGFLERTTLDEPAVGTVSGENSETGSSYASPYLQRHDNTDDHVQLSMPVGLEWHFHKYATLRLGTTFFAGRSKTDRNLARDVDQGADNESLFFLDMLDSQQLNVDSDVGVSFTNGLEINVNDRFILDLQSSYTGNIDLTNYGFVSARLLF